MSPRGYHATATQGLVKDVPPASGCIIHAVCRLQQCNEDVLLLVEVDTQHHCSHHQIALEEKLF